MDDQQIIQQINNLGRWFYQFDLKGHLTPVQPKYRINRHQQRKRYIFEPLVHLCGGSLAGKRILDLGCNAGFWSLAAIENDAAFVLGVDARPLHIDQANFVFETKEIAKEKYQFVQGNIFEVNLKEYGNFDIVLCLGLLYHISKPMSLFEIVSRVNTDILVIDTNLSRLPGAYLEIHHDDIVQNLSAFDFSLVMYPTKLALIQMVRQFGYSVAMLKPRFQNNTGLDDYKNGVRRAFLCAKQTDLENIKIKAESVSRGSQFVDFSIWVFRFLLRNRFSRWLERKLPKRWTSSLRRTLK
jgi:2-polyprenyl-3-methyl-5-hydroxy-6-metoxy-1,4-benzoquinol methylase